ncbi:MAG: hypothetical protein HY318_11995 [Armatimonadetes bacterium]|nr:hypothetical protein [Armatimonadota bacterium]
MRPITKQLTVATLEIHDRREGKYTLKLRDYQSWSDEETRLTLTAHDMVRFGLDPREQLAGARLELTLKAISYSQESHTPHTVKIISLSRSYEIQHSYSAIPPDKWEKQSYHLKAKTPVGGGTLVLLPPTYYELNLRLTEGEYRRLRSLPADTALEMSLRSDDRAFCDFVLKRRGVLNSPRVFPKDYAANMVPLVKSMIAYYDGDVDVVGHYAGLEIDDERECREDARPSIWRWHREYFAVDSLSPEEWEASFTTSVDHIDGILKRRYCNRLPIKTVHHFYDNVETSAWMSKKRHAVDELSVGLEARCVSRESHWLPSVVVEARSVDGNRKACEAICDSLCEQATGLFKVKFDHQSLTVEEIGSGAPVKSET